MIQSSLSPLVELTRGSLVESIHFGALAIADASGNLIASVGDPQLVANLRSSSKPFQTLPLIEEGGAERFGLSDREIALTCASHSGTDEHVSVLKSMQARIGVCEADLQCGVDPAGDADTAKAMQMRGELPTAYRHNCSGKHTGMLAQAVLARQPLESYLTSDNLIQRRILRAFAEMVNVRPEDVLVGIDGCSAPTFAVPLQNAALGYARLADPGQMPEKRALALERIRNAMMAYPEMVAGPGRFDTLLMAIGRGKIVCKGGAEGYQAVGLLPGALGPGSPGLGIVCKVIDGDSGGRARPVIMTAVLRQLGALDEAQLAELRRFDRRTIGNSRRLIVGEIRPAFHLETALVKP